MKANTTLNAVNCFQQLLVEINLIKQALDEKNFYSIELYLMEEKDVMQFLKISRSTLYNYREKKILKSYSFFGRNTYFRHEIYEAIILQLLK